MTNNKGPRTAVEALRLAGGGDALAARTGMSPLELLEALESWESSAAIRADAGDDLQDFLAFESAVARGLTGRLR